MNHTDPYSDDFTNGWDHEGNPDEVETCSHCFRDIG